MRTHSITRMGLVIGLIAGTGCLAEISDPARELNTVDAGGLLVDAAPDATPDAPPPPPCVEGDARATDSNTGHCYFIVYEPTTREAAAAGCDEAGAHLASLDDQGEHDISAFLAADAATLLTPDGDDYWLGGSDADSEGVWLWADGSPVEAFLGWREGEPNNGVADVPENCMILEGDRGTWDDRRCDASYGYLCERDVAP